MRMRTRVCVLKKTLLEPWPFPLSPCLCCVHGVQRDLEAYFSANMDQWLDSAAGGDDAKAAAGTAGASSGSSSSTFAAHTPKTVYVDLTWRDLLAMRNKDLETLKRVLVPRYIYIV